MTPRRLQPQQRREHLLDMAAAMFAEKPCDDVMIHDIAARAGVSRALMYHYFSTKRDVYVALFKRASDRFLARVSPDPQLPLAQQLATALEGHIQSFVDHPFEAITINRGGLSDDPAIQAIVAEQLNVGGQRLVDQLVAEGHPRAASEIAVEGWLAFVRDSPREMGRIADYLARPPHRNVSTRTRLRDRYPHPNQPLTVPNIRGNAVTGDQFASQITVRGRSDTGSRRLGAASVDAINTFSVSAGHFAYFRVF